MGGGAANFKLSPKASKMCVFSGKYAKKNFAFLRFWRQRVWGSAAILKLSPGAKICAIFIMQGSLIPYIY